MQPPGNSCSLITVSVSRVYPACSLRRQNELIAEDDKRKTEQEKQKAEKQKQKEQHDRQQKVDAKTAAGLSTADAKKAVDADTARQQAAAERQREAKKKRVRAKEEAEEAAQRREVDQLTDDAEKEAAGKGDEKELAELNALVEGLLAMTQPSAVEAERKRLQELLGKAGSGTRKKREIEAVKKNRPPLYKMGVDDDEAAEHPIQSVNDLARWHVERLKKAEEKAEKKEGLPTEPQQEAAPDKREQHDTADEADKAKAEAAVNESEAENDTEDAEQASRDRLSKQLQGMLGKLRDRLHSVDAEIGSSLHLLHPDKLTGRLDDSELIAAVQRLHAVKAEDVSQLIARLKKLVSKRRAEAEGRTDGSGDGDEQRVALSVSDITALSEQLREEQEAKKEDSGHQDAHGNEEGKDGEKQSAKLK